MNPFPTLTTARLVLRAFTDADAPVVQQLAGDARVADTTLLIPHPYPDGAAEAWIATHEASWIIGRGPVFAITLAATGELVGAIGLRLESQDQSAELGYWIGVPFWNRGYASEAARAVVDFAFAQLALERVRAHHFVRNPASGRVLEKAGLAAEPARNRVLRKGVRDESAAAFVLTRAQWERRRT